MAAVSHLNALRALEASVRLGSFTAAATELGVSPAAVGQQVRKLENALGRPLLIRGANGFQITEHARLAATKLTAGLAELRDAVALMREDPVPHHISVTVVPTIAEHWLAPRLAAFRQAYPQIDLRIDSTHHVHYQASDSYDFALRYDPPATSGFRETALFREWLVPVCTPELATRVRPQAGEAALTAVPLIDVDRSTGDPDWIGWAAWGARFGHRIDRPALHFTFTTLALRAAYDGHGVFLAQLSIVLPDILAGRMAAPFGPACAARTGYPYRLIALRPGSPSRSRKAFTDWVLSEASQTRAQMASYLGDGSA